MHPSLSRRRCCQAMSKGRTLLPAPSHSTVASAAAITSGAVVSSIVNVAVVDVALPQSSVAVKVTVAAPVAPQSSLNASKSFVHITPPHASVAVAPPLLSSQFERSDAVACAVAFDRSVCCSQYVWSCTIDHGNNLNTAHRPLLRFRKHPQQLQ